MKQARDRGHINVPAQTPASDRRLRDEDAEDEAWVAQMMEWLSAPRADLSAEMIRRVIARVEYLA